MVRDTLIIIFEIVFQVYALNGAAFKKIEVSPDLWTSMVYKVQFSITSSLSEKAATCLMDSTCEGFAFNEKQIFFVNSSVNEESSIARRAGIIIFKMIFFLIHIFYKNYDLLSDL